VPNTAMEGGFVDQVQLRWGATSHAGEQLCIC